MDPPAPESSDGRACRTARAALVQSVRAARAVPQPLPSWHPRRRSAACRRDSYPARRRHRRHRHRINHLVRGTCADRLSTRRGVGAHHGRHQTLPDGRGNRCRCDRRGGLYRVVHFASPEPGVNGSEPAAQAARKFLLEAFNDFLMLEQGASPRTDEAYGRDLARFATYAMARGAAGPPDVTARMLREYVYHLKDLGLAPASI